MTATPEFIAVDVTDERKQFEAVQALAYAERDGEIGVIQVGPFTAFTMISALQYAWRADFSPQFRTVMRDAGDLLIGMLAQGGHTRAGQVAMLGWDRSFDVGPDHACAVKRPQCTHNPALLCPACAG